LGAWITVRTSSSSKIETTQRRLPVEYLDKQNFRVSGADDSEEALTASEYDLLKVLAENPNRTLSRDWQLGVTAHRELEAFDRAIDLRITRLRRKIEVDPTHPNSIRTVRGVGSMFVPPKDWI